MSYRASFTNTPFQMTILGNFLTTNDWAAEKLNSKLLPLQSREFLSLNFALILVMGAFILLIKLKLFFQDSGSKVTLFLFYPLISNSFKENISQLHGLR